MNIRSGSSFIYHTKNNSNKYRIIFPKLNKYPKMLVSDSNEVKYDFKDHNYPICSCPAYYYSKNKNGCKHIRYIMDIISVEIDWKNNKYDFSNSDFIGELHMFKEFQWIK